MGLKIMSDNQKIIEKVKGLLAIAKDEKSDEESQSAFILAQKLMIKYKIDKSTVEDYEMTSGQDNIDEESVTVYKRLFWWERQLAQILSENFRVRYFINSKINQGEGQTKRKIMFFGHGSDLELAKEMFVLAYDVLDFRSKKFIDDFYDFTGDCHERYRTQSIKSSYIRGFLVGLSERFDSQRAALRKEYAVMVLVPEEVEVAFKDYSKDWGNPLPSVTIPPVEIEEAYEQGVSDGNDIDLTRSTIKEQSEF